MKQVMDKNKDEITSVVSRAVVQIEIEGESVFPEFYSSTWYYGDIYVFVWRDDGIRVVYPPDQSGLGHNMLDLKDINGKPIGKLFIQTAAKWRGMGNISGQNPGPKYL